MILSSIMDISIAKLRKRIVMLENTSGYKLKVKDGRYLIFESKNHYIKTKELERKAFDFVNHVLSDEDENKEYISLVHISTIESYLKCLPFSKINVKSFDLFCRSEGREDYVTPFESKFPTLNYFFKTYYLFDEEYSNYKIFMKKLKTHKVEEKVQTFERRNISICWNRICLNIFVSY